jgi:serine O-acetyltransferase
MKEVTSDVSSARERDPAARGIGTLEILTGWAGVQALLAHRVAHALWDAEVPLVPRTIAYTSRAITGVEIHPAARIGSDFFIDHGSGVVIGETAEIGDDVTLYQGVTLGGTSLNRGKRHPTLEDGVIVGAGAKILGAFTVGRGARIGANAVVLTEVPPGVTMAGIPAKIVGERAKAEVAPQFLPYGTPCDDTPDPIACQLSVLHGEVARLRTRLSTLEEEREQRQMGDSVPGEFGEGRRSVNE